MGLTLTFFVPGDKAAQIQRRLNGIGANIADLRPAFGQMADDLTDRITPAQFASSGRRGAGTGWAPLTAAYAARKRRDGFGSQKLVRTGRLLSALTGQSRGDSIREVERRSLRVGVRDDAVPYGKYHQSGTGGMFGIRQRVGRGMPVRAPIQLTEADRKSWARMVSRYIMGKR